MEKFSKLRKFLSIFLGAGGAAMAFTTIGALIDANQASEEFRERTQPVLDKIIRHDSDAQRNSDRARLQEMLHEDLSPGQFEQNLDLINRVLHNHPSYITAEERNELHDAFFNLSFRHEDRFFLKHPEILVFGGFGLVALSAFLDRKKQPKSGSPLPPSTPWDTTPPLSIAKGRAASRDA